MLRCALRLVMYFRLFFIFIIAIGFTGCSWMCDPCRNGQTSCEHSEPWVPRCIKKYPPPSTEIITLDSIDQENLNLATMVDIALQNSPLTKQTWALARASAYEVAMRESRFYPQINGYVRYNYQDVKLTHMSNIPIQSEGGNVVGYSKIITEDLSLYYMLWDFNLRNFDVEAARQALYASDWTNNREIQQVIINVLEAYYRYLGVVALIVAKQSDLENVTMSYNAAMGLYEAGIKTKLDVLQAKTDVVNTEVDLVNLQGREKVALGALAVSLGLPPNSPFDPRGLSKLSLDMPFSDISANIDELVDTALQYRPDLSATVALYREKQAEVGVVWAAQMPNVTLNGDLQRNKYTDTPFNNYRYGAAYVTLNVPIFSGFFYTSQLKKTRENMRAAHAEIDIVELNIMQEVVTSYYNFKTAEKSLKFNEEFLKFSQEAYEIALTRYQEGIATILDLLLAQKNLADARSQLIQDRTRLAIALANISFNTGLLGRGDISKESNTKWTNDPVLEENIKDVPAIEVTQ